MAAMKTTWKLDDIIDFEYFQHLDQETPEAELHRRDRDLYLQLQRQGEEPGNLPRRHLLRRWLNERRQHHDPQPGGATPGGVVVRTLTLLRRLAALKGLIVGLAAGLAFFTYSGETPVNVFHFLLVFVGSQLFFALVALIACLLRLLFPGAVLPSLYTLPLHAGFRWLLRQMRRALPGAVSPPATETAWTLAIDTFRSQGTAYGALFYWPLFAVFQGFAIFCNIGLLAATLARVAFSDLAFGWQSTLSIGADALHRAVQLAATPWSWLFPGHGGYPSLAEIEGSRIVLKDGISHLATADLVSWWPFLVLALLVYGLLPRIAFAVAGRLLEERSLAGAAFDTASCRTTVRRMKTPLLSSQAPPEEAPAEAAPAPPESEGNGESPAHLLPQVVLVPDDIFGLCPGDRLCPLLARRGFAVKSVHKFMTGYDEDEEMKNQLASEIRHQDDGLLILMEGWMPPLVAFLTYLRELREILPEKTMIHLALVGRPMRSGFAPLAAADLHLWKKKSAAARDPYLHVFALDSP